MKNKSLNIFLVSAGIFLVTTCFFLQVKATVPTVAADLAPRINVIESHITSINGNNIQGEFKAVNNEQYYLSDLSYVVKLFQGNSYENLNLVDVVVPSGTFFIAPGATITKTFTYTYPRNIVSGDYTVRAQVITSRGQELGWNDVVTPLSGANKFLEILTDYSKVIVDDASAPVVSTNSNSASQKINNTQVAGQTASAPKPKASMGSSSKRIVPVAGLRDSSLLTNHRVATPLEGIVASAKEDVSGYLKVQNTGDAITVVPQIKIFQRQINMSLVKQYNDSPITFAKGETKDISLKFPKMDNPDSYLIEVKFYRNNEQVSGIQYFRWVLQGDSGKIIYIKADKDYFVAGDNINLTIQTTSPADASDGGQGQLQVIVSNKNGNVISQVSSNVSLAGGLNTSIVSIPVKSNLISPFIDVKLIKAGKILDENKINLPVYSTEAKQLEKSQMMIWLYIIILIVILILIIVFLVHKFKFPAVNRVKK